jgi:hypothetical protein
VLEARRSKAFGEACGSKPVLQVALKESIALLKPALSPFDRAAQRCRQRSRAGQTGSCGERRLEEGNRRALVAVPCLPVALFSQRYNVARFSGDQCLERDIVEGCQ